MVVRIEYDGNFKIFSTDLPVIFFFNQAAVINNTYLVLDIIDMNTN